MNIVPAREFVTRRRAMQVCIRAGLEAQWSHSSRLAAKLYRAGMSVEGAVRNAVPQRASATSGRPAA